MPASVSSSILISLNLSVSNEPPSSVRRCFAGMGKDPSSHNVVMNERGMTIEVGAKPLFTSLRCRNVLVDRMST